MHSFECVDMYVGACACCVGVHVEAQGQGQDSSRITLPAYKWGRLSQSNPALRAILASSQSTWPLSTSIYTGFWWCHIRFSCLWSKHFNPWVSSSSLCHSYDHCLPPSSRCPLGGKRFAHRYFPTSAALQLSQLFCLWRNLWVQHPMCEPNSILLPCTPHPHPCFSSLPSFLSSLLWKSFSPPGIDHVNCSHFSASLSLLSRYKIEKEIKHQARGQRKGTSELTCLTSNPSQPFWLSVEKPSFSELFYVCLGFGDRVLYGPGWP